MRDSSMGERNYKILIADDEGIVIESLSLIIRRNYGDQCIVNSAKTGRQVIELAEEFRPDIIFMDIQMPGINGIDAIKEIKKTNKSAVFIIISAYDKFTYAKEAINLGDLDYLTKPTNKNKIISTLDKAIDIVNGNRKKRYNELLMKEKMKTVLPIIENGMIYSILFKDVYSTQVNHFKNLLGITWDYGFVLLIQYGDLDEKGLLTNPVGNSIKAQSFYPVLQEITKEYFNGIIGPVMVNQVLVVVPWENLEIDYNERIHMIDKARSLNRKLKRHIDTDFRIGIGSIKKLEELSNSYKEAVCVLGQNKGKVVHVKDISTCTKGEEDEPDKINGEILNAMKAGNLVKTKMEAERYIDWIINNHYRFGFDLHSKVYELLLYIENTAYHSGVKMYSFINRGNYLKELLEMNSQEEIKQWFMKKLVKIYTNLISQKNTQNNSIILKAKEYISKNYFKDISLDDVSKEVDISPYYFSKLFKEETGENFIDYLTRIRIRKAKELLKDKESSIKKVCLNVGYNDPNYFSRIFKKCTGKTPTEYREELL